MAITNQVVNVFAKANGVGRIVTFALLPLTLVGLDMDLIQLLVVATNVKHHVKLVKHFLTMVAVLVFQVVISTLLHVYPPKLNKLIQPVAVQIVNLVKIMVKLIQVRIFANVTVQIQSVRLDILLI
jgi:hypothetical protein